MFCHFEERGVVETFPSENVNLLSYKFDDKTADDLSKLDVLPAMVLT